MTTVETTTKNRSREWERNRRNKFNDAITKLGEVVRAIDKANEPKYLDSGKDCDNTKYAKIEIVQKAILCLTNSAQEKTQLRAEILALQVQLEATKENKISSKDVSTQVYIEANKRNKKSKYMRILVTQNSQHHGIQEEPKCLKENKTKSALMPKLPNILPRNVFDKKAPENAIVVLPAAPYIFPQRQLLFPTMPPTIVVVDHNIQALNKSVPIVSRSNGDITKTTMVNILPISAYSCALSATKHKKSVKLKPDTVKKAAYKHKPDCKKPIQSSDTSKSETSPSIEKKGPIETATLNKEINKLQGPDESTSTKVVSSEDDSKEIIKTSKSNNIAVPVEDPPKLVKDLPDMIEKPPRFNIEIPQRTASVSTTTNVTTVVAVTSDPLEKNKSAESLNKLNNKSSLDKNIQQEQKDKNKIPTIDTTLCDGGNVRLELAEELLAASPTAAFLMSFPLVSGNRADSPAEEPSSALQPQSKDTNYKRNDILTQQVMQQTTTGTFLEKAHNNDTKIKTNINKTIPQSMENKLICLEKHTEPIVPKGSEVKTSISVAQCNVTHENPFLNLPMPSLLTTSCTLSDNTFGLDFDCNLNKPIPSQPSSYVSNNNIFYKNDPFSTVKNTIYSTSSISSSHDFSLYPCAMEKYTSKNKSEFANMDDSSLMKMGSSRLTYDIDLGWSHKGFDFVNCTTSTPTFTKDILTTVSSNAFCTSYNPFNPEFHVPLVSTAGTKKEGSNKTNSSYADTITNFYSQPSNLWTEEPFYTNSNVSKTLSSKHHNYLPVENLQANSNLKQSSVKHYEVKDTAVSNVNNNGIKSTNHSIGHQLNEKYTKKSPSKMHINWMTSEIRPMQNICNPTHSEIKEPQKLSYSHLDNTIKRQDNNESNNYFPFSMHNFPTQTAQEEFQVWPSVRPLGTTEISIDPPPLNLPTLVGDLALGPHDKKKNLDSATRAMPQQDLQNCTNFFSVTQLMNRSNDNLSSRYQPALIETTKPFPAKQNVSQYTHDSGRKVLPSRVESHIPQPYVFNDPKPPHSYENMAQFPQAKTKSNSKPDKTAKTQKNNYSAEALLRGGSYTQKLPDNNNKLLSSTQKYGDFRAPQDTSVAQVSHFPPIMDYSENGYTGQQFSGTSLYNTTTNTISNSFYSNFMPGSSNLMSSNYASGPFTGEFIDYNQSTECNYSNHKYEELKMRNNPPTFHGDKVPSNYKSSRRDSAAKHKLECSKKESSKKYQSKRTKVHNDVEEWNDPGHALWHNKGQSRKHSNMMSEELPFPNYVSNQMPSQYQPEIFNSHLMPSNMQPVGHNVDRFPVTSRANFNLSTIFPEITMKVQ